MVWNKNKSKNLFHLIHSRYFVPFVLSSIALAFLQTFTLSQIAYGFEAPIQPFEVLFKIQSKDISSPLHVEVHEDSLFILDGLTSRLYEYGLQDKSKKNSFSLLPKEKNSKGKINSFVIFQDQIYSLSAERRKIYIHSLTGQFIKDITLHAFAEPRNIAFLPDGTMIVSDMGRKNLFTIRDGKVSEPLVQNINLNTPIGLLPISNSEVIFSDFLRKIVGYIDPSTKKKKIINGFPDKKVDLFAPRALATDGENIYISDSQVGLIHSVKISNESVTYSGVVGFNQKQHLFRYPVSMAYSEKYQYLAVADLLMREVVILKKGSSKDPRQIKISDLGNFHKNDSRQCLLCHDGSVVDSLHVFFDKNAHHPTELSIVDQKNKIPDDVPSLNGKLVCLSCHTLHENRNKESFFRFNADRDSNWCSKCHNYSKDQHALNQIIKNQSTIKELEKLGSRFSKDKKIICETCHTVYSSNENKNKLVMDSEHVDTLCKTCHESSFKSAINHPLDGKNMNHSQKCLNCHSVDHKAKKHQYRLSNTSSKLCVDCHKEQKNLVNSKHDNKNWQESIHKATGIDKNLFTHDNICLSCHSMHDSVLGEKLLARTFEREKGPNKDVISIQCLNCHATADSHTTRENGMSKIALYQHQTPLVFNQIPESIFDHSRTNLKITLYNAKGDPLKTPEVKEEAYLGCVSCHEPHNAGESKSPVSFMKNSFDVISFCVNCHGNEGLTRFKFFHTDKYRSKSAK